MRVAVVGAGVTGLFVAHELSTLGVDVTVYERTGIGAGASGVQPGGIRQQWGTAVNCVLARESLAFYRDAQARLGMRVDPGFRACGYLFLAHSVEARSRLAENVTLQNGLGVPSRIVEPDEAARLVPGLDPSSLAGAAWCAEDGFLDRPQAVLEALGERAAVVRAEVLELRPQRPRLGARLRGRDDDHGLARRRRRGLGVPHVAPGAADRARGPRSFLSEPIRERLLEPLVVSPERRSRPSSSPTAACSQSDLAGTGYRRLAGRLAAPGAARPSLSSCRGSSSSTFPLLVDGFYDVTPDRQAILGEAPAGGSGSPPASAATASCSRPRSAGSSPSARRSGEDPGGSCAVLRPRAFRRRPARHGVGGRLTRSSAGKHPLGEQLDAAARRRAPWASRTRSATRRRRRPARRAGSPGGRAGEDEPVERRLVAGPELERRVAARHDREVAAPPPPGLGRGRRRRPRLRPSRRRGRCPTSSDPIHRARRGTSSGFAEPPSFSSAAPPRPRTRPCASPTSRA